MVNVRPTQERLRQDIIHPSSPASLCNKIWKKLNATLIGNGFTANKPHPPGAPIQNSFDIYAKWTKGADVRVVLSTPQHRDTKWLDNIHSPSMLWEEGVGFDVARGLVWAEEALGGKVSAPKITQQLELVNEICVMIEAAHEVAPYEDIHLVMPMANQAMLRADGTEADGFLFARLKPFVLSKEQGQEPIVAEISVQVYL